MNIIVVVVIAICVVLAFILFGILCCYWNHRRQNMLFHVSSRQNSLVPEGGGSITEHSRAVEEEKSRQDSLVEMKTLAEIQAATEQGEIDKARALRLKSLPRLAIGMQ